MAWPITLCYYVKNSRRLRQESPDPAPASDCRCPETGQRQPRLPRPWAGGTVPPANFVLASWRGFSYTEAVLKSSLCPASGTERPGGIMFRRDCFRGVVSRPTFLVGSLKYLQAGPPVGSRSEAQRFTAAAERLQNKGNGSLRCLCLWFHLGGNFRGGHIGGAVQRQGHSSRLRLISAHS